MTSTTENRYDQIPYESHAFGQTHPNHLAAMAKLFGLMPHAVETSRVLELGCASGGNLIPMAATLPQASFLGLDLSARQIADGKKLIDRLGLTNIELRQADILDIDDSFGRFDYIIAHGVYSWVPAPVQDKLLEVCNRNLAPGGVAFVSYNTFPGWRMRGMLRDAMLYHAKQFADPVQQVKQARAVIDFLAQSVPTENNPYGMLLKLELEDMRKRSDSYLAHDHLEGVNEPTFFHEFAEKVAAHQLQYLADSDLGMMLPTNFTPQVAETLRVIAPDMIRMEQYMDFLRNRAFRQSLLVHRDVRINRQLNWKSLAGSYINSYVQREGDDGLIQSGDLVKFKAPNGSIMATRNPMTKAGLTILMQRSPRDIQFEELCKEARAMLDSLGSAEPNPPGASDAQVLGSELIQAYPWQMINVRAFPWRFTLTPGPRPKAGLVARVQAERGPLVTNLRHDSITLDEPSRHILPLLDGQNDRAALLEIVADRVRKGVIGIKRGDQVITDPDSARDILEASLDQVIENFAKMAFLEE